MERVGAEGVVVTTLEALHLPAGDQLRSGLDKLADTLAHRPRGDAGTFRPNRQELLEDIEVWQWGLQEPLLDMVENYIGIPVRYYGADVRCEVADGAVRDVRQWHRDIEDHRMLKILLWLNDVDATGGPFEYISRDRTEMITRSLRYVSGFVPDRAMEHVVARRGWKQAVGARWTAVVADTSSVFHRAMPPKSADRYSVTFTWTSRRPIKTMPADPMSPDHATRIRRDLNLRQLACLPRHLANSP